MSKVNIVEVGPRDGLQNEKKRISIKNKLELIGRLEKCGLKNIEVGAFVSPRWVPQMNGTSELVKKVYKRKINKVMNYSALVPNLRGMNDALQTPIKKIAIFGSCSESFSQKNINCSINDSFKRFKDVINLADKNKLDVRGYLSTAFGCPYDGRVSHSRVVSLTQKMLNMGVYEVAISDTIGIATPKDVEKLIKLLKSKKIPLSKIALHMHNTHGTALANILRALDMGVRTFDTSVGGLGGCPYAGRNASGNLATEDLVYMLNGMGFKTNIDLKALIKTKTWLERVCKLKTRSFQ